MENAFNIEEESFGKRVNVSATFASPPYQAKVNIPRTGANYLKLFTIEDKFTNPQV
jgi:hypothetical protein